MWRYSENIYVYIFNTIVGVIVTQRRERFVRLGEARVSKAMKSIRVIGNLSNRSNYEYSDADVRKIVKALQLELSALEARFQQSGKKSQPEFKLQ